MFEQINKIAIPFLVVALLLIVWESTVSLRTARPIYNLPDTLCNFAIFAVARASQPLFIGYLYWTLHGLERFKLFDIPTSLGSTLAALMLTEFLYYWEHRFSHKFKTLWFFHEVHHSSKVFNLTTSFRLHWLGRLTAPIMFAPLIVAGFKPEQVVLFFTINLFYQFFLHTTTVPKLGWLEGVVNTPSAHRVHHARNRIYLDKNFGGMLMIWDRLFGTYCAETETPKFGILGKFESNNPLTVQFHKVPGYQRLSKMAGSLTGKAAISMLAILFALTFPALDASASGSDKMIEGHIQVDEPVAAPEPAPQPAPKNLIGRWKASILEIRRHPTVWIKTQDGNQLTGIYSGLLGKFPLTGVVASDGQIKLYVDFSRVHLLRFGGQKSYHAVMDGKLDGDTIQGTAILLEFGDRLVHFQATRQIAEI